MKAHVSQDVQEVMEAVHYRPSITLLMPSRASIGMKEEMQQYLKREGDKIRKKLSAEYPNDTVSLVMQKLNDLFAGITYDNLKKSIAVYVSPVFAKLLYLDVPLEEKLVIDEVFEIRDIVYSKKQLSKYLLLVLGSRDVDLYLVDEGNWVKVLTDSDKSLSTAGKDLHDKVANFSDTVAIHDAETEKFLHYTDHLLKKIESSYPLPLFVMGVDSILGHFRKITHYSDHIAAYIHGDHQHASLPELKKIIQPYINKRDALLQQQIKMQLNDAAGRKKLSAGIKEVWQQAKSKNAGLLVVEKNYMFSSELDMPGSNGRDLVDESIRYVLEAGGDVAFVGHGLLKKYKHIALIRYY